MSGALEWACHVCAGSGFLVAPTKVLTAGHVVGDEKRVEVALSSSGAREIGTVRRSTNWDLAVIELDKPFAGIDPAPIRPSARTAGHRVLVPGNLTDVDSLHRFARARVVAPAGDGSIQIDIEAGEGYAIVPGHSGGPVIDEELGAVIGVCNVKEAKAGMKVGWFVPIELAGEEFPELIPWLGWRLSEQRALTSGQARFGPLASRHTRACDAHWYPRSRGVRTESRSPVGSVFSGRAKALADIRAWIATGNPGVFFVTGEPGAGKSAVVARALVDADPLHGDGSYARPFRHAFYAKDRSSVDLARGVSDALGGVPDAEVESALELVRQHSPLIAIDGLDEAAAEQAQAIVDLAHSIGRAGGQVLIGARRSVIPPRPDFLLNLDTDLYFSEDDLADYCRAVLCRDDQPELTNAWRTASETAAEAKALAGRANRNFLIGGLLALARSLTEPGSPASDRAVTLEAAFDDLLTTIDRQLGWR